MTEPPPQESRPDEVLEAYRRASAGEHSRPSERVRASILARSRHAAASGERIAEPAVAPAPALPYQSRWKWRLAASLAAIGIAGLLAVETLISPPRGAAPARPDSSSAPAVAEVAPSTARPDSGAITPAPPAAAPESPAAAPALSEADASRNQGSTARLASPPMNSMAAPAALAAPSGHRDQVIAALHARLPELFAAPANSGVVPIALVLNGDGTVYRIAREDPAQVGQADAAWQLSHALGVGPEELDSDAQLMTLDRTAAQANTIVVALGIRKRQAGQP